MTDPVSLWYTLEPAKADSLLLTYTVTNRGDGGIFLFSHLPRYLGGDFVPDEQRIYTFWDESGLLHLTKRLWPVPDDVDVYMPEVPFLAFVPAGRSFRQEVRMAMAVDLPYETEESPDHGRPDVTRAATFSVGYVPDSPEVREGVEPAGELFTIAYGEGITAQVIADGGETRLRPPVHA